MKKKKEMWIEGLVLEDGDFDKQSSPNNSKKNMGVKEE